MTLRNKIPKLSLILLLAISIIITGEWYLQMTTTIGNQQRFSLLYLTYTGTFAILFNSGIWLTLTSWGRRHWLILGVLHIPLLLFVDFLLSEYGMIAYVLTALAIFCYWNLFKNGAKLI